MVSPEMARLLRELREKAIIGFVGGSDFPKISEQLGSDGKFRGIVFIFINP